MNTLFLVSVKPAAAQVVEKFWSIFDYISTMEPDDTDNPVNLHRNDSRLIAVNIPRFMDACRKYGQQPDTEEDLRKHLKDSKSRKYITQKPVNTKINKSLHCWIFERPERIV